MNHSVKVRNSYRTIDGYRMNMNQEIEVKERDEKSIMHWLRNNIFGREFIIHRVSWL